MNELNVITPPEIGKYKLLGSIGEGAFSIVRLALHKETGKYFACKIVPRKRINTAHLETRFQIEIRINQQLHHPGLVQMHDVISDLNNFYIFMEFCPNGELFQYIVDRTRLQEAAARPFLHQILESLAYIHSQGVSHRDLKPENLLLDQFGKVKISDFGLSRYVYGQNNLVDTPCGSPCYASPECISGHSYNGYTSDVWSVGVIFYAMLTGQLPWTKRNQTQLFRQIKKGEFSIPDYISPEGKSLIRGLMTVDFEQRLTTGQALQHPWFMSIGIQFPLISTFPYVSLRKVDELFAHQISNPQYNPLKLFQNSTSPQFSFSKEALHIQYHDDSDNISNHKKEIPNVISNNNSIFIQNKTKSNNASDNYKTTSFRQSSKNIASISCIKKHRSKNPEIFPPPVMQNLSVANHPQTPKPEKDEHKTIHQTMPSSRHLVTRKPLGATIRRVPQMPGEISTNDSGNHHSKPLKVIDMKTRQLSVRPSRPITSTGRTIVSPGNFTPKTSKSNIIRHSIRPTTGKI